jgi:Mn-dependent DtxR family transcriptional regulator
MLAKLLDLLHNPRTHSIADLADALDTTPTMVETMLEDLERLGRLRQVTGCGDNCHGCSMEGACTPSTNARIWALVETPEP